MGDQLVRGAREESWRIRRAGVSDGDDLMALIEAFNVEDRHEHDEAKVRDALGPLLANDDVGEVWLLEDEGVSRGYCVVTWGYSLESGGRECVVDEIFVMVESRGLGGHLLDAALASARRAGVKVAFLETEAHNERVRTFYQRHSFAREDSIWMRRALS